MARNFKILTANQGDRSLRLHLLGDFDGTSAHELANTLDRYGSSFARVDVDTDGLRNINSFGLEVFITKLKRMRRIPVRICFLGRFKYNFAEE